MIELFLLPLSPFQYSAQIKQEDIISPPWSCSVNRVIELDYKTSGENYINSLLQWENIKSIAKDFLTLENDWDGYGSVAIDSIVVNNSIRIIDILQANKWIRYVPDVSPVASGTISLSWEYNDIEAYLEIGRTRYSGYIQNDNQAPIMIEGELDTFEVTLFYHFIDNLNSALSITEPISKVKILNFSLDEVISA